MRLSNDKAVLTITFTTILLCVYLHWPLLALSQESNVVSRPLLVGVTELPPVCMKTADNRWGGLGIEIWQAVAQIIEIPFEFREFNNLESLLDALEKKEIDVIPTVAVQDRFESTMDFSQSYLKSGLSIAVPAEDTEQSWYKVFESIFSFHIIKAIVLLLFMTLVFGIIVWLFERRRNSEMFSDGCVKGTGDGVWWAMVTMSTVGYGDKAPKTIGGRIFAFIWMIFSIVFITAFTATITSQLTIGELRGKIRGFNDLYDAKVGCVFGSEGCDFLSKKGVTVIPFQKMHEGLMALDSHIIDAFVQDENIGKHIVKSDFPGRVQVLDSTFDEYFVSIALQQKSPLRKPINKALLKLMKTEKWAELLNRYTH
jgi:polar amino acid transport system substrate-binding protein